MNSVLLRNGALLDPTQPELLSGHDVLIEGKVVREELQMGADQIKIMASGGVSSPTDPIGAWGYSEDEIRAIVEETRARNTYVLAHAYTAESIARAVRCGVRCGGDRRRARRRRQSAQVGPLPARPGRPHSARDEGRPHSLQRAGNRLKAHFSAGALL